METEGWLYDGETAVRRHARVRADGSQLGIELDDGRRLSVPSASLVHLESRRDGEIYGRSDMPGWRLALPDGTHLAAALPGRQRYGRWIDRIGLWPAVAIGIVVSALVLFAANRFPVWVAPYVPASWEKKFGDALVGDFGGHFCSDPAGQAALSRLTAELAPDARGLNVRVVNINLVNAAALPGGNIVIFDELIEKAESPDEVAGVLAHEIGHIERHHVTQALIREYGFNLLIAGLGGTAGSNINMIDSLRYSRGAEAEADGEAIATLGRAGISPAPTAAFFARLSAQERRLGRVADGLAYLSTHPQPAARENRFRSSAVAGKAYRAALTPAEWRALRNICRIVPGKT